MGPAVAIPTGTVIMIKVRIIASGGISTLGPGFQTLDRQIDFSVLISDDHDLHILTFGQVLANVTDIGIGNLRNMYHTYLIVIERDECAKIRDRLDLAL